MNDTVLRLMARLLVAYRNSTGTQIRASEVRALMDTEPFGHAMRSSAATAERIRLEELARRRDERNALVESISALPIVQAEADKRRRRDKKFPVTVKMARAMREARAAGATYVEIARLFDVSIETARRHSSEADAERMREYERERNKRLYQDPRYAEQLERKRQKAREYAERNRRKKSV